MCKNKIKYYLFFSLYLSVFFGNFLLAIPGDTCEDPVDYGLINGDTVISGNFDSEDLVDDYWIRFTTTCNFRDITVSTEGFKNNKKCNHKEIITIILIVIIIMFILFRNN